MPNRGNQQDQQQPNRRPNPATTIPDDDETTDGEGIGAETQNFGTAGSEEAEDETIGTSSVEDEDEDELDDEDGESDTPVGGRV